MNLKRNKLLLIIFIISFLVRFSFFVYSNVVEKKYEKLCDSFGYLNYAENIVEQGVGLRDIDLLCKLSPEVKKNSKWLHPNIEGIAAITYIAPPGYPYVLASIIKIFGHNYFILEFFNVLFSSLIPVFIYLISSQIFSKWPAILASFWSIFYYYYFLKIPTIMKESFLQLLFIVIFYFMYKYLKLKKLKYLLVFSILFTLLIHTDERYLAYTLLFSLFLLFSNKQFKENIKAVFIFGIIVFTLSLPWMYRNYKVYDKFILITPRTESITDKFFRYPDSKKVWPATKSNEWYLSPAQIDSVVTYGVQVKSDFGGVISIEQVEAMQNGLIPHEYTNKLEHMLVLVRNMWEPIRLKSYYGMTGYRFRKAWSLKAHMVISSNYGILLLFSVLGFWKLYFRDKQIFWVLLLIIIYHTLFHVVLIPFSYERYRIPIDFIIIIVGSYGIVEMYNLLVNRRKKLESE